MATRDIVVNPPLRIPAFLYLNPTDLSTSSGYGTALGWQEEIMVVWGRAKVVANNKLTGYPNLMVERKERFAFVCDQRTLDPDLLGLLWPHNFPITTISYKPLISDNDGNGQKILSKDTTTKICLVPKEPNRHSGGLIYNAAVTTRDDEHSIIHQIDTDFKMPIAFEALPDGESTEKVYRWGLLKDMTL